MFGDEFPLAGASSPSIDDVKYALGPYMFSDPVLLSRAMYASRFVCAGVVPLPDGPPSADPHPRYVIAAGALLGAIAAARGLPPLMLAIFCLVCGVLAAIWCADFIWCKTIPGARWIRHCRF